VYGLTVCKVPNRDDRIAYGTWSVVGEEMEFGILNLNGTKHSVTYRDSSTLQEHYSIFCFTPQEGEQMQFGYQDSTGNGVVIVNYSNSNDIFSVADNVTGLTTGSIHSFGITPSPDGKGFMISAGGSNNEVSTGTFWNGTKLSNQYTTIITTTSSTASGFSFFFAPNSSTQSEGGGSSNAPTHSTPKLNTSLGLDDITDELTCYNQSTSDANGDYVKNSVRWYNNGKLNASTPHRLDNDLATYLPFDTSGKQYRTSNSI
jgi:hypothetical protein